MLRRLALSGAKRNRRALSRVIGKEATLRPSKPFFKSIPFAIHHFVGYSEGAMD